MYMHTHVHGHHVHTDTQTDRQTHTHTHTNREKLQESLNIIIQRIVNDYLSPSKYDRDKKKFVKLCKLFVIPQLQTFARAWLQNSRISGDK